MKEKINNKFRKKIKDHLVVLFLEEENDFIYLNHFLIKKFKVVYFF